MTTNIKSFAWKDCKYLTAVSSLVEMQPGTSYYRSFTLFSPKQSKQFASADPKAQRANHSIKYFTNRKYGELKKY